jgi:YtcA family
MRHPANRVARRVLPLISVLPLAGCQQAPSFNILGSFFPAWLICFILGILLAAGTRFLLLAVHLEEALSPPIVMYPCLTALFTFGLWLLVFH